MDMGYASQSVLGSLLEVGLGALPFFVDNVTSFEAVEPVAGRDCVMFVTCEQMRETPAGCRGCFEAAIAPARIQVEPIERCPIDDRRAIHRHIDQAPPAPQNSD